MSSRFTALPLSIGESFVLETDHKGKRKVVLVDGGQTKGDGVKYNTLYKALRRHCSDIKDHIDIAICTHSDHDHSGGFPSFIKTWTDAGNRIEELWLPALWSPAVRDALINPDHLLARLQNGASQAAGMILQNERALGELAFARAETDETPPIHTLDEIIHDVGTRILAERGEREIASFHEIPLDDEEESQDENVARSWGFRPDELDALGVSLEESDLLAATLKERSVMAQRDPVLFLDADHRLLSAAERNLARSLLATVVETADAIRDIAKAAVNPRIPVRWFDFTPFELGAKPAGGVPGFLKPLNTVEVGAPLRAVTDTQLFFSLKLTEQNVSSLVFQRVETEQEPSVIFVADSRLAFGVYRPEKDFRNHLEKVTRPCVYTSAHHGSRNNDRAYEVLENWLGEALYQKSLSVRNGGVWNQTLAGYLAVKNRRCAQCYQCHGGDWSQLVQVQTRRGRWMIPPDQGGKCGVPRGRRKIK